MASRMLAQGARALTRTAPVARTFSTSPARLSGPNQALPARKPVGALRGGLFGFFLGSSIASGGIYYYAVQEYKTSNELLTEDIYALQSSVERLSKYLETLEEKMEALEKKKK